MVTAVWLCGFHGRAVCTVAAPRLQRLLTSYISSKKPTCWWILAPGDGVVLREAKTAMTAIGYELQPLLVLISRWLSRHDEKVSVQLANFWRTPLLDETTVVYLFGDGRDIAKMVQYLQYETNRLGRDIWLLSYGFEAAGLALHKTVGAHNLYLLQPQS